jgi:hypothetical protein
MEQTPKKANTFVASNYRRVKELENLIELKDLEMINFVDCMHDMIWAMEKQEAQWAKKARLIHMHKFDLTHIY